MTIACGNWLNNICWSWVRRSLATLSRLLSHWATHVVLEATFSLVILHAKQTRASRSSHSSIIRKFIIVTTVTRRDTHILHRCLSQILLTLRNRYLWLLSIMCLSCIIWSICLCDTSLDIFVIYIWAREFLPWALCAIDLVRLRTHFSWSSLCSNFLRWWVWAFRRYLVLKA